MNLTKHTRSLVAVVATTLAMGSIVSQKDIAFAGNFPSGVNNLQQVQNHYWKFCNYDFTVDPGTSVSCSSNGLQSSVDHPVTIIFGGNATGLKLQDMLLSVGFNAAGIAEYNQFTSLANSGNSLENPSGQKFSSGNNGMKTPNGCNVTSYHLRWYGGHTTTMPDGTQYIRYSMNDPYWGYYLMATTHEDIDENCSTESTRTGYEEDAAKRVESDIQFSSYVNNEILNWDWFNNRLSNSYPAGPNYGQCVGAYLTGYYTNSNHVECAQSDGYADFVSMV